VLEDYAEGIVPNEALVDQPRIMLDDRDRAKSRARRVVDFLMCWTALGAMVNVAVGAASFVLDINLILFGLPITSSTQRWQWIGIYLAWSAVGFTYMLWRQSWRCRLSDLLILVTFLCAVFALMPALQGDRTIQGPLVVIGIGIFALVYSWRWSRTRQLGATS
jgi:membrane protease YdiL (CAAX protease family)